MKNTGHISVSSKFFFLLDFYNLHFKDSNLKVIRQKLKAAFFFLGGGVGEWPGGGYDDKVPQFF